MSVSYSALIDEGSAALLSLTDQPFVVTLLAKSPTLEARVAHGVNWPNYGLNFSLEDMRPYCGWAWDWEKRRFSPTPRRAVTPELRQRSDLAIRKCEALREIVFELTVARYPVWRGVLMQEHVYAKKREQAQAFKLAGCPEDQALFYPYVLQYADLVGMPLAEAAEEILFKAQLDDEYLAKTELLRLKYFNLMKDATKVEEIEPIMKSFRRDTYAKSMF
jgi:hypothetical protein